MVLFYTCSGFRKDQYVVIHISTTNIIQFQNVLMKPLIIHILARIVHFKK